MDTLFLIAHKVRGEATFDIAICCEDMGTPTDPGPWWLIPTSGHRAKPYWYCEMQKLGYVLEPDGSVPNLIAPMPADWPDHYAANNRDRPAALKGTATLLEDIGL